MPAISRKARWPPAGLGAAALPLLVAGIWAAWQVLPLHILFADYRTAPGEQRVVDLADGSRPICMSCRS